MDLIQKKESKVQGVLEDGLNINVIENLFEFLKNEKIKFQIY
ncbi:hypothetical protein [Mesomycoplasma ovipneumoniae]|nr:hypothetical protein [Mesomycoplasma ovipneumoniae]